MNLLTTRVTKQILLINLLVLFHHHHHLSRNRFVFKFFSSIASKIMSPYQYWLDNGGKVFSLQFNILRPSIFDLKTDENGHSFLSVAQKITHHQTYTKFLQYKKPQNYIFANYKFTSPFTMSNQYTIDHSKITGNLRNYDLIKQYFCLLSHIDTSRPDH